MNDTEYTDWPVCPTCGHVHRNAWEWDFGIGIEGDGKQECEECEAPFYVSRHCSISYSTRSS